MPDCYAGWCQWEGQCFDHCMAQPVGRLMPGTPWHDDEDNDASTETDTDGNIGSSQDQS